MLRRSFSFRINTLIIAYYVMVNILVFTSIYYIIHRVTLKSRVEYLTTQNSKFNQQIAAELINIEKNTKIFSDLLNSGYFNQDLQSKNLRKYFETSSLAGNIFLLTKINGNNEVKEIQIKTENTEKKINFSDSCFNLPKVNYWNSYYSDNKAFLFHSKDLSLDSRLIVFIDENRLRQQLSGNNINNGNFSAILDNNFNYIADAGVPENSYQEVINKLQEEIKGKSAISDVEKSIKYSISKNKKIFSHIIYNSEFGIYVTLGQMRNGIIKDLRMYSILAFLAFLISVLIVSVLVILSNYNITKTFNELFRRVQRSAYLRLKPSSFENEIALIHKSVDLLENQIKLYEKNVENLSKSSLSLENDLKIAKKLQYNLLPSLTSDLKDRKEFELYAFTESLFDIGGDFYDYFLIDEENLLVAVADVSGKGIPASLFMIYTHTLLRSISESGLRPSEIIVRLNNKLIEENISDMFVTIFLGVLKIKTGDFQYCNAAHNHPLIIHSEGRIDELPETHGIPVGIYPNRKYTDSTITLSEGDQIFIYTDGLIDTTDENDLKYTVDVLKYNLMGTWFFNTKDVIEKIKESVTNFRGNIRPGDDLTILNLKYKPREN